MANERPSDPSGGHGFYLFHGAARIGPIRKVGVLRWQAIFCISDAGQNSPIHSHSTDSFPFDRFNFLSDNELLPALKEHTEAWCRNNEQHLLQLRGEREDEHRKAIKKRRHQYIGRPQSTNRSTGSVADAIGSVPRDAPLVLEVGSLAGWIKGKSDIFRSQIVGPQTWFFETTDIDLAEAIVAQLAKQRAVDHEICHDLNPRYGLVASNELDASAHSIRWAITQLAQGMAALPCEEIAILIGKSAAQLAVDFSKEWHRQDAVIKEDDDPKAEANQLPNLDEVTAATASVLRANEDSDINYDELLAIKKRIDQKDSYVGSSVPILRVFERIKLFNRDSDSPVLILGPTGAGKSTIAELIHDSSSRSENKFEVEHSSTNKSTDMAFIISHWAGHAKNSTVKGVGPEGRDGLLQKCQGGTIFVDEAHDFSPDFQDFLRPVIDRTPIHRSDGPVDPVTPNVRLIIATNQNLEECVRSGKFKHDFYDRIRHRQITIPDLNSRKEDIFEFVRRNSNGHKVDPSFYLALLNHSWPGNVRELLKAIELATSKASEGQPLTADLLELPTTDKVIAMPKADIQGKLYAILNAMLEPQGFRHDKKGMALHVRMAKVMGVHPREITKLKKAYDATVASA